MNNVATLDSSFIIAALLPFEEKYKEAIDFLSRVLKGELTAIQPFSVLVEVVGAIKRRTGSTELANKVKDKLLGSVNLIFVEINKPLALKAANITAEIGLRGMDAIIFATAKEYKTLLKTYDKEMLKRMEE